MIVIVSGFHLPQCLSPLLNQMHGLLFIFRPRRDGRLSWPCWLSDYFSATDKESFPAETPAFLPPCYAASVVYNLYKVETWKCRAIRLRSGKSREKGPKSGKSQGTCVGREIWLFQLDKIMYLYYICTVIHFLYVMFTENLDYWKCIFLTHCLQFC